jgi:spore germination protein GerM
MPARKPKKKTAKRGRKSSKKKKSLFSFKKLFLIGLILIIAAVFILNKKQLIDKSTLINGFKRLTAHVDQLTTPLRTKNWKASLYFGGESSESLVKEFRPVSSVRNPEKMSAVLIKELINGPVAKGVRTIPEQTRLLAVDFSKDGLLIVNFSKEFTEQHPGGSSSEIMTVYSIVNTLTTNIKDVKMVKIIQEGRTLDTIAGHIDCNKNFYPDLELVR